MIRRLHLQGWRAFEDLTLSLEEGLTFVVAENGVGKTSLMEAAAWGVYGKLSGVDARAARRFGTSDTRIEVELELPDGRTLNIERHLTDGAEPIRAGESMTSRPLRMSCSTSITRLKLQQKRSGRPRAERL